LFYLLKISIYLCIIKDLIRQYNLANLKKNVKLVCAAGLCSWFVQFVQCDLCNYFNSILMGILMGLTKLSRFAILNC